ncbi:MAG: ABC transporter ATP-binding protein [Deltaproteobacteria bacterium]|nr:ABC transporter ATP-binding protein [Deltaproteobacteria bacterium]
MGNAVEVENLSKKYHIGERGRERMVREAIVKYFKSLFQRGRNEAIWALRDVSFSIRQGEVLGIVGRNGAGKSTLLKILSRITYPTSGTIKVNGRVASLLEVGTGFHEELTGRENIYLNGSILGMRRREIESRMDQIVAFSGVEQFLETPIKRYSSGMRLRLGFAVAAHLDADVMLVDEVLAVGDAEFQKKCLSAMDNLSESGRTVLFVSHNMEAVENLCERAIWIDDGIVRQDGPAREIIQNYLSTFAGAGENRYDLAVLDRKVGNGDVRFTGIAFLEPDGTEKTLIRCGDPLVVRLHFEAKQCIRSPHFAFELFTEFGTKVTSLNTWASGFEIPLIPRGRGHVDLEIPSLNIVDGRYYISLWAASAGNLWYDRLDHCAYLDVTASDFYHSGRAMTSQHYGLVLLPCTWKAGAMCDDMAHCQEGDFFPDSHRRFAV